MNAPEANDRSIDTCYIVRHGFIYCGQHASDAYSVRQLGVILLSMDDTCFVVCQRGLPDVTVAAAAVAPLVSRKLLIGASPVLRFNVCPGHPTYPALTGLRGSRVMPLERSGYQHLNLWLTRLRDGSATMEEAEYAFERVVERAALNLPPGRALPERALEMTSLLDARPELSLEALATRFGQSPAHLSRSFSAMVGMSVRDYKEYARGQRLLGLLHTDRSLTEIALEAGFRDSSQLSHTFQRWFGCSPSYLRNPAYVKVFRQDD